MECSSTAAITIKERGKLALFLRVIVFFLSILALSLIAGKSLMTHHLLALSDLLFAGNPAC